MAELHWTTVSQHFLGLASVDNGAGLSLCNDQKLSACVMQERQEKLRN